MNKPVWIASSDPTFLKKMDNVKAGIARAFAEHGGCHHKSRSAVGFMSMDVLTVGPSG